MDAKETGDMAKKVNKYLYLYVVQGYYSSTYGWEDCCQSEDYKEAVADLRAYRIEERGVPHRLIQRREPNPEYVKS